MNFPDAIKSCFAQYAKFSGRASRYEFWNFIIFLVLMSFVLTAVNSLLFGPTVIEGVQIVVDGSGRQTEGAVRTLQYDGGMLATAFMVAVLLPWLAVTWRRLHDTGRPGWFALLPVAVLVATQAVLHMTSTEVAVDMADLPKGINVPETLRIPNNAMVFVICWLIGVTSMLLVFAWLCRPSQPETNKYGPNPNEVLS